MKNNCFIRFVPALFCIMVSLTPLTAAGDETPSKLSEQGTEELKRLVTLSRLVAGNPSLLREKLSASQARELSAEPFGCRSSDLNECVLSQIANVLLQQSRGKEELFAAAQGAAVQIRFPRATDDWSDKDIENNWDVVKKWTDAAGPAVLLLGAFMLSQKENGTSSHAAATLIGSGATLLLIGNLGTLGQMYGGVNDKHRAEVARRTINALQDIEASRKAYEDSQLLYAFLDSYSRKAQNLLRTMAALSKEAQEIAGAAPSSARSKRVVGLCDETKEVLAGFKEAAGLTDEYARQLSGLYKKIPDGVLPSADANKIKEAWQRVMNFNADYYAVIVPFLDGVPEAIEAMQNIKAAVIANSIADKQYF